MSHSTSQLQNNRPTRTTGNRKERHFRRSLIYEYSIFSCFDTDALYHIFAYLEKLAYQISSHGSKQIVS